MVPTSVGLLCRSNSVIHGQCLEWVLYKSLIKMQKQLSWEGQTQVPPGLAKRDKRQGGLGRRRPSSHGHGWCSFQMLRAHEDVAPGGPDPLSLLTEQKILECQKG